MKYLNKKNQVTAEYELTMGISPYFDYLKTMFSVSLIWKGNAPKLR